MTWWVGHDGATIAPPNFLGSVMAVRRPGQRGFICSVRCLFRWVRG